MIRRPPRSTPKPSSAASDVYKRQAQRHSLLLRPPRNVAKVATRFRRAHVRAPRSKRSRTAITRCNVHMLNTLGTQQMQGQRMLTPTRAKNQSSNGRHDTRQPPGAAWPWRRSAESALSARSKKKKSVRWRSFFPLSMSKRTLAEQPSAPEPERRRVDGAQPMKEEDGMGEFEDPFEDEIESDGEIVPVSYTHLTLPTKA